MIVHPANIQDRDGAKVLLGPLAGILPNLQLIWADGGYAGKLIGWVREFCGWTLVIVKRNADLKGFHVLPRGRYRRLSKGYERQLSTSETMIHIANDRKYAKEAIAVITIFQTRSQ